MKKKPTPLKRVKRSLSSCWRSVSEFIAKTWVTRLQRRSSITAPIRTNLSFQIWYTGKKWRNIEKMQTLKLQMEIRKVGFENEKCTVISIVNRWNLKLVWYLESTDLDPFGNQKHHHAWEHSTRIGLWLLLWRHFATFTFLVDGFYEKPRWCEWPMLQCLHPKVWDQAEVSQHMFDTWVIKVFLRLDEKTKLEKILKLKFKWGEIF